MDGKRITTPTRVRTIFVTVQEYTFSLSTHIMYKNIVVCKKYLGCKNIELIIFLFFIIFLFSLSSKCLGQNKCLAQQIHNILLLKNSEKKSKL